MKADALADCWATRYPRPDPVTNANNAAMVKRFGRDFRHRDLNSIDRGEARQWAIDNPAAASFVRTMLNDAVEDGLVDRNHFAGLGLARSRGRRDLKVPTLEQIAALEAAAADVDERLPSMIDFAAGTGIRLGESRALRVIDLLGAHRADVQYQLDRYERQKAPKEESERLVMIPERAHRVELWGRQQDPGTEEKPARLWPFSLYEFKSRWKKTREKAGIWIQWHELRHFCATWLLDRGATAEDVAIQFGHKDGGTLIRELYGHPDKDLALARLEALAAA